MRNLSVVCGPFIVPACIMFGCYPVMTCRVFMVFRRLNMMICALCTHMT
jgi:hypothetical protein